MTSLGKKSPATPANGDSADTGRARARVLVVDDEELIRWSLAEHLRTVGYEPEVAVDGEDALARIESFCPDLVVLDLQMPKLTGLDVLRRLRAQGSDVAVMVITAHGEIASAVEATSLGATAYLKKPFDLREVTMHVEQALASTQLAREVRALRDRRASSYERLVGRSPAMQKVFETLTRLEDVDAPTVLITGESGTGKDLVAQAIHARGPRKNMPYLEIDCASLSETLIESELFGHEKGSFTDAKNTKRGLFEVAKGGVVFLDEIGEMSLATQAKLLRALENRRFKRVGGVVDVPLDAAVLAATHKDLRAEVLAKRFREDLFYRLHVVPIELPPLRRRPADIPALVDALLARLNAELGRDMKSVSDDALGALMSYAWPGNVRELRNVLERAVILHADASVLTPAHLPREVLGATRAGRTDGCPFELPEEGVSLDDVERGLLEQALTRTKQNQSAAARLLGISRYALRYRMEKHGMR